MIKKAFAFVISALLLVSCGGSSSGGGGEIEQPLDISGEWELTGVSTKSAVVGSETVTVYVKFASGSFDLYQIIGEGLPRKFSGTYSIAGKVLSGKYSEGTAWSSPYEVVLNGSVLTLTKQSGTEIDTYKKTSIPQEIISRAI